MLYETGVEVRRVKSFSSNLGAFLSSRRHLTDAYAFATTSHPVLLHRNASSQRLRSAFERLVLRTAENQLQKHIRFFSPNIRRLFPVDQVYIRPNRPAPKNYLFIDKKYTATIRQCRELTEETGHSLRVLQLSLLNRRSYTGIHAHRLVVDQVVRNNERSFFAHIVAEH